MPSSKQPETAVESYPKHDHISKLSRLYNSGKQTASADVRSLNDSVKGKNKNSYP